ncbi:MAG: CoA transferase subunit A [candidate division NC10 bacterium]|nr:CoA transferase subunit A [candidate division NC10 bacterium]
MADKVRSLQEVVASIPDGANLTFGGFAAYFTPLALVRELIRQGKRELEMTSVAECWVADYLAGAGRIRRVRFSNFMFEGLGRCQNFARGVERGEIEVEDYSHFAITSRLVAAGLGVPFLPIKPMAGTDLMRTRGFEAEKARPFACPFTGEPVLLVPAARPDVAVLHVARADRDGNSQLFGYTAVVEEQARAAQRVIVTTEEVVEDTVIRAQPELTVLPSFLVDAVVEVPFGAHPTGMYRYYDPHFEFMRDYYAASRDPAAFRAHLEEWVLGPADHWAYLRKVGLRRLLALRSDPGLGIARMHARTAT